MGNFSTNSFPTERWSSLDGLDNLNEAISSLDAAIRNLFGVDTSALDQAFDISSGGAVRILDSLQIGQTTEPVISDIINLIPDTPGSNEQGQLATVYAIRRWGELGGGGGGTSADLITTDTTDFDGILSAADVNVQLALDTIDDHDHNLDTTYLRLDGTNDPVTGPVLFSDSVDIYNLSGSAQLKVYGGDPPSGYTIDQQYGIYGYGVTGGAYLAWSNIGIWYDSNKVWHAGNDGTGSTLDADLLDGQHGSYYSPTTHDHDTEYLALDCSNDPLTGPLDIDGAIGMKDSLGSYATVLKIFLDNVLVGASTMDLILQGTTITDSFGGTVWTATTDGPGSGLNADLLDGTELAGINYALVSGNDSGTNVTAAELEELSDGSDTSLHVHTSLYSPVGHNHDADYVELTGDTMSGNLVISKTSSPTFTANENGVTLAYFGVQSGTPYAATNASLFQIQAASQVEVNCDLWVNGDIYLEDSGVQYQLAAYLAAGSGSLFLGGTSTQTTVISQGNLKLAPNNEVEIYQCDMLLDNTFVLRGESTTPGSYYDLIGVNGLDEIQVGYPTVPTKIYGTGALYVLIDNNTMTLNGMNQLFTNNRELRWDNSAGTQEVTAVHIDTSDDMYIGDDTYLNDIHFDLTGDIYLPTKLYVTGDIHADSDIYLETNNKKIYGRNYADTGYLDILRIDTADNLRINETATNACLLYGTSARSMQDFYLYNTYSIAWRNAANTQWWDTLTVDASDRLVIGAASTFANTRIYGSDAQYVTIGASISNPYTIYMTTNATYLYGQETGGSNRVLIGMTGSNQVRLGQNTNRMIMYSSGNVYLYGAGLRLDNAYYLYGLNQAGTAANPLIGVDATDTTLVGNTGFDTEIRSSAELTLNLGSSTDVVQFLGEIEDTGLPTTTHFPNDHDFGFYTNTTTGLHYWCINHGGTIYKSQMT